MRTVGAQDGTCAVRKQFLRPSTIDANVPCVRGSLALTLVSTYEMPVASSTPVPTTQNVSKHCQMSSGEKRTESSQLRSTSLKAFKFITKTLSWLNAEYPRVGIRPWISWWNLWLGLDVF